MGFIDLIRAKIDELSSDGSREVSYVATPSDASYDLGLDIIEETEEVKGFVPFDPSSLDSSSGLDLSDDRIHSYPVSPEELTSALTLYVPGSELEDIRVGPSLVTYLYSVPRGTDGNRISRRSSDLSRDLGVDGLRIVERVPGTPFLGVEIPNDVPTPVPFKEVLSYLAEDQDRKPLEIALGMDSLGSPMTLDLASMPHLLVAGTTGSGKSVFLNAVITSLVGLNSSEDVQLILIDPKQVEFDMYSGLPHLVAPPIHTVEDAMGELDYVISMMESRLKVLRESGYRSVQELNERLSQIGSDKFPYLVVVIDEFADLMLMDTGLAKELERKVVRIAQKSRAAGIHMIIATQKPIVKVVTSLIKGNMPARISFRVPSSSDSRVILDQNGAEDLLGKGDMLISTSGYDMKRAQGVWVSDDDIRKVLAHVRT